MASAAAAMTCSQLSTRSRAGASVGESSIASNEAKPSWPAMAAPTASGATTRVRSATWPPSS